MITAPIHIVSLFPLPLPLWEGMKRTSTRSGLVGRGMLLRPLCLRLQYQLLFAVVFILSLADLGFCGEFVLVGEADEYSEAEGGVADYLEWLC